MSKCVGFAPILPKQPKLMILGTMPSVVSMDESFYYAHPRNAFWQIMSEYFSTDLHTVETKKKLFLDQGILLWDVLKTCERQGSLDSAIVNPIANDFETLFIDHPNLSHICFNGQAAQKLFKKQVLKRQIIPVNIEYHVLPSTSPANARLKYNAKKEVWYSVLNQALT